MDRLNITDFNNENNLLFVSTGLSRRNHLRGLYENISCKLFDNLPENYKRELSHSGKLLLLGNDKDLIIYDLTAYNNLIKALKSNDSLLLAIVLLTTLFKSDFLKKYEQFNALLDDENLRIFLDAHSLCLEDEVIDFDDSITDSD